MTMSRKPRGIDLFCGAGGMSLGFIRAGFDMIFAVDNDPAAVETHCKNLGPHAYTADVYELTKSSIEDQIHQSLDNLDVVVGGPPCQGFSVQRRGSDEDVRNHLVLEYLRLVLEIKPKFFVMENVAGLESPRGRPFLKELYEKCGSNGYTLHRAKLTAAHFGVPQLRQRVVIVGERREVFPLFSFPEGSHKTPESWTTVRSAIADLMSKTEHDLANHRADRLSPVNLERIRAITEGQGRDSLPEHLQLDCHRNNPTHRHLDVYGRMAWDAPSPTITARFDSFSRGRFGHPELDRTITLREGARLQSFPDDFVFHGSKVQVAKQIGNAVPPLMAQAIAERILQCL